MSTNIKQSETNKHILQELIKTIDEQTNVDLSSYKITHIENALSKRFTKLNCNTQSEYLEILKNNSNESTYYLQKLLNKKTALINDSALYVKLEYILHKLFLTNKIIEDFRVWIPACGNAKEAYLIAITIVEIFEKLNKNTRLTIFVTDINPKNIEISKNGLFDEHELDIYPKALIDKYFHKKENTYRISDKIRSHLLFSTQDLIKDAPFSKIDLISCQNLLQLFDEELKKRVISIFHYALNNEGILLFNPIEDISIKTELFDVIDKKNNIFSKTSIDNLRVSQLLYNKPINKRNIGTSDEVRSTNRKLLRKNIELEFTQKAFNTVLETIQTDILILDMNFRIIKYTNKITNFFNIGSESEIFNESLINKKLKTYNLMEKFLYCSIDGIEVSFDIEIDEKTYWIDIKRLDTPNNFLDIDSGLIISMIDKSEIVKKDKILSQQSKMASMGEMLTNIAHQWRQPLNHLSTLIMRLQIIDEERQREDQKVNEIYEQLNSVISNMSTTIDDFRNFFKPSKDLQEYKALDIMNNTINLFGKSMIPSNVNINIDIDENLLIKTIKNQLSQVLLILLNNSIDAIKINKIAQGEIHISVTKKDRVHIIFKDNAGGIPKNIIDRVFEPYFTTKFKTDGTGVGLYMLKSIIENNMKGKIKLKNEDNGLKTEIIF